MDRPNLTSIPPTDFSSRIGTPTAPLLLDVRRAALFEADEMLIVAAQRRGPDEIATWQRELPRNTSVVVYCVHETEADSGAHLDAISITPLD